MTGLLLALAALLSAAASLSVEIVIVRLGAPYIGQSLLPWSASVVSVLIGLTSGHILGGIVGGTTADVLQLRNHLGRAWFAAALTALAMPALVEWVAAHLPNEQGFGSSAVVAIAALAYPPSVAAGFVLPLVMRIAVGTPHLQVARTIGAIYAASAAGSVVGTATAGFVLLEALGSTGLARFVATLWITLAVIVMPWRRLPGWQRVSAGGLALVALAMWVVNSHGPCLVESRYTCIQLLDRTLADGSLVRFMILDEGVHSASDRDDPARLHLGYVLLANQLARAAFAGSERPSAMVIGGGGATLPRTWATASPSVAVTVAELDGTVAAMASDAMWTGGLPHLKTIIGDGRATLRSLPPDAVFDVVLMDAYRSRSVPPHLVTQEFDAQVAARLTDRGLFVSNVIDRMDTPSLALSVGRTLSTVFPAVDFWLSEGGGQGTTNVVVAAWKDANLAFRPAVLTVVATVMDAGEAPRSQDVVWWRIDFRSASERWPRVCSAVLTDDWAPVDRLLAGGKVCHAQPPE